MPAKGSEAIPKSKSVTMSVKLQQKFWKSKTMGLKRKKILLKARMRDPRTFFSLTAITAVIETGYRPKEASLKPCN